MVSSICIQKVVKGRLEHNVSYFFRNPFSTLPARIATTFIIVPFTESAGEIAPLITSKFTTELTNVRLSWELFVESVSHNHLNVIKPQDEVKFQAIYRRRSSERETSYSWNLSPQALEPLLEPDSISGSDIFPETSNLTIRKANVIG